MGTNFYVMFVSVLYSCKSRQKTEGELGGDTEKRVLVLGAGFVSAPLVEYLHREKSIAITVGK